MTVSAYLESKEIKLKELADNFAKIKEYSIPDITIHRCPMCGEVVNLRWVDSEAWTSCCHCIICDIIIMIVHSDRMSGVHSDTVYIFKEKAE